MSNWGIRRVAAVLLATYFEAAAAVVLWPTPVDGGLKSQLKNAISSLHDTGMPQAVDYAMIESLANVIMFVPLGLLITVMAARRFWFAAPLIGVALSTSAEVAQLLFLPNRFPTLADVAANSTGALIGTLVVLAARGTITATAIAITTTTAAAAITAITATSTAGAATATPGARRDWTRSTTILASGLAPGSVRTSPAVVLAEV